MKTRRHVKTRTVIYVAILITAMGWTQQNAIAESESKEAASTEKVQLTKDQEVAKDIILRMAEFLAKAPQFSVNLSSSYEVLQESGQMIEFGEHRRVIVNRPNGLRVEVEHGDEKHIVQYDGKEITIFNPLLNVYAQTPKTGGIDEAVKYFLRDLGMRLPLAVLLISNSTEEIDRRTLVFNYVENTVMDGVPVNHLAGRTETVDYQVWIPENGNPLPLRIVLTYKDEEGHPAHRINFSDWNLAPKVKDSQFVFTPSEGVRKIAFLAHLPKAILERATNPEQTGESK